MNKFNRNHYMALKKALNDNIDPLVLEGMEILNIETRLSDVEFAASLQGLEETYLPNLWINERNEVFMWTSKGFVPRNWHPDYAQSIRKDNGEEEDNKEEN